MSNLVTAHEITNNVGWDEDVENFEKEILEALNEMEE